MKLLAAVMALMIIFVSVVMADVTKEDLNKQRQGYLDELKKVDGQLKQLEAEIGSKGNMVQRLAGAIRAIDETLETADMKELIEKETIKDAVLTPEPVAPNEAN